MRIQENEQKKADERLPVLEYAKNDPGRYFTLSWALLCISKCLPLSVVTHRYLDFLMVGRKNVSLYLKKIKDTLLELYAYLTDKTRLDIQTQKN